MATALTYYTELQSPTVNGDVDLWGNILNATTDAWDRALAGLATASLAAGNWTPSTTEGECLVLKPTGILVANRTIIVPAKKRRYIVWNICTGAFSVTIIVAGVGVECQQGVFTYVYCDGTDVYNVAGGGSSLTLTSSDAGAGAAPTLDFYRNSASPAASDLIGIITLTGEDSAGNTQTYATLTGKIIDPTSTSEDGELLISTVIAGTVAVRGHWGAGVYAEGVTGGDKGAGSANFTTIYQNNVALASAAFVATGTSGATIPLLNGTNTASGLWDFTAGVTLTTTSTGDGGASGGMSLISSDAGAGFGPSIWLDRLSASPAASDAISRIIFRGKDSGGTTTSYVQLDGIINDPTDGSEDSLFRLSTQVAGAQVQALQAANGVIIGAPTGSYQGTGTLNATALYVQGAVLTSAATTSIGTSGSVLGLLNANLTFSGNNTYSGASTHTSAVSISSTGTGTLLTVTSTDAGATSAPDLVIARDSASPIASDNLGRLIFSGRDSAGNFDSAIVLAASWPDPTSTSEDGKLEILSLVAGSQVVALGLANGLVIGAPTGSFKGTGTVNAAAGFYANGSRMVPTIQVITATGTYTPTTGAVTAIVELVGGGGGGGGGDANTASQSGAGGGGGAGGYSRELITLSGTYSVTIGAAGTAGSATNGTAGGNGGTTSFGTGPLLQATGGTGGSGSGASVSVSSVVQGGGPGVGTLGDVNISGGAGTNALWNASDNVMAGTGGCSLLGGGGAGAIRTATGQTGGAAAGSYGGGGGGGACCQQTTGAAGGLGGIGVVVITEFYG